jgi:hypothetical protein
MSRNFKQVIIVTFFFLAIPTWTKAQKIETSDYYTQIKNYDISKLLTADSIIYEDFEGVKEKIERAEVLGFIGDNYQRFQIRFISIIQNTINPYEYLVYGKTKVKRNICSFQGKIIIKQSKTYLKGDNPEYKQGYSICDVLLFEDNKQSATGLIKGKLKVEFIIDQKDVLRYDALNFPADGFSNNQFVGTWTSYKDKIMKRCNWGDYRIPECGDLDTGSGEFSVNEEYLKNGWENYELANSYGSETLVSKKAKLEESNKWWK